VGLTRYQGAIRASSHHRRKVQTAVALRGGDSYVQRRAALSKSQVSQMAKDLDEQVELFRTRRMDTGPCTFVACDARVLRSARNGRVVEVHPGSAAAPLRRCRPGRGYAPCCTPSLTSPMRNLL
jgi:hypothetical protein